MCFTHALDAMQATVQGRDVSHTATLSSKSQITIPSWVRRKLGLAPGARLNLRVEGDTLVIQSVQREFETLEGSLRGIYGDPTVYVGALREDRF